MGSIIFFFLAFCICYYFANTIYNFLVESLYQIYLDKGISNPRMIYTALTEAFFTYLKVSFYGALFLSFPILAMQVYKFAAPGLYKNEKSIPSVFNSYSCFILFRSCIGLLFHISFSVEFLLGFQTSSLETGMAIELEAKVNEYLSLVLKLMFAFGLAFQIPVALTLLARAGLVSSQQLKKEGNML